MYKLSKKGSPEDYHAETAMKRRLRILELENPMNITHYIGFDVHKKHIKFCVKVANGEIVEVGRLVAGRSALRLWAGARRYAWHGSHGSNSVQRLDLRYPEALRCQAGHGTPSDAEGHRCSQEEERSDRCAHHRRSAAALSKCFKVCRNG